MKISFISITCFILTALLSACTDSAPNQTSKNSQSRGPEIVILFDNDVHGALDGYPKIAALKKQMQQNAAGNVMLISTGDFVQGSPLCSMTRGMGIVPFMNLSDYDFITPGSHDFDYGIDRFRDIADSLEAKILCCNLIDATTGQPLYLPYAVRDFDGTKVAFIGFTNPATQYNNSPQSYLNADGSEHFSFSQTGFYEIIQKYIDKAKAEGAKYVIGISHMGNSKGTHETAQQVVQHTHGFTAIIDGHDHRVVPEEWVTNTYGDSVLYTSTGTRFRHMGALSLSASGRISSRLVPVQQYQQTDSTLATLVDANMASLRDAAPVGYTFFPLQGYDRSGHYERNVQTNLGSLYADALRTAMNAEIGWVNAASVSASINEGEISMMELLAVCPYGNQVCAAEVKGQQILDGLEFCTSKMPKDFGNYPVISGLLYDVDTTMVSPVLIDDMGFLAGFSGPQRRVSHVTVYSYSRGGYIPLDPNHFYRVASVDYILRNHGSGNIFNGCRIVQDTELLDIQVLQQFIARRYKGIISESYNYQK